MTGGRVRIGVGTRFQYDGEVVTFVELIITEAGNEVVLQNAAGTLTARIALRELLVSDRVTLIPDQEDADELAAPATVVLAELPQAELRQVRERAAHVREVLTGYRSGSPELADTDEPRPTYRSELPIMRRYEAKAQELGIGVRTLMRWVAEFRRNGEAGLAPKPDRTAGGLPGRADQRWADVALEVMVEHTGESTPSRTMVIDRTNARVLAGFGDGVVKVPSRATAFRVLEELERRHPTFRLSAKRNRDIADRPDGVYGKLRPTRPGEYVLMDSTRLDVFALDPVTLRWINCELTVAMDWYTRPHCACPRRRCSATASPAPATSRPHEIRIWHWSSCWPSAACSTRSTRPATRCSLINRGCQRAARTGAERLDQAVLDGVKNDAAAENARRELDAALTARRITSRNTTTTARGHAAATAS